MDISLKYMFHLSIYQYGKSWLIIMLTGEYTMAHMILNFHIIFQYVPYIFPYIFHLSIIHVISLLRKAISSELLSLARHLQPSAANGARVALRGELLRSALNAMGCDFSMPGRWLTYPRFFLRCEVEIPLMGNILLIMVNMGMDLIPINTILGE